MFKTMSPQNYPSRTAALREQQLMAKIDGWVHGLGKKEGKGKREAVRSQK